MRFITLGLPTLVCLLGCERQVQPPNVSYRDSGGAAIVENVAPVWDEVSKWRISAAPLLTIGAVAGDTNYELHNVSGVTRLSDGSLVVANAGSHELRWYAADGSHIRSLGRRGGGDREFERLDGLATLAGDSIVAFDSRLRRVSVFSREGDFRRSVQYQGPGSAEAIFSDGSLFAVARDGIPPGGSAGQRVLNFRPYRYTPSGDLQDSLGTFPAAINYFSGRVGGVQGSLIPFTPEASFAVAEERVFVVTGELYEVRAYSSSGQLLTIFRIHKPSVAVTELDIAEFKGRTLANHSSTRAGGYSSHARLLEELPYPETMPTYSDVLVDALGNIWTAHYGGPWQTPGFRGRLPCASCWTVFDRRGRWLGDVELTESLEVLEIGDDHIAGIWRDEANVEYVRIYSLTKPIS